MFWLKCIFNCFNCRIKIYFPFTIGLWDILNNSALFRQFNFNKELLRHDNANNMSPFERHIRTALSFNRSLSAQKPRIHIFPAYKTSHNALSTVLSFHKTSTHAGNDFFNTFKFMFDPPAQNLLTHLHTHIYAHIVVLSTRGHTIDECCLDDKLDSIIWVVVIARRRLSKIS